eukprot:TRINITY_DN42796_c0_g1_i1.p1 TRINITY_DN42796_c0_g1~~TRINITY_DN42796_c0_g1_i1.p1  ORF type:complete len:992 (+),score=200.91 TRINITY_DN42796_c0_g1_i1:24-2978(+)
MATSPPPTKRQRTGDEAEIEAQNGSTRGAEDAKWEIKKEELSKDAKGDMKREELNKDGKGEIKREEEADGSRSKDAKGEMKREELNEDGKGEIKKEEEADGSQNKDAKGEIKREEEAGGSQTEAEKDAVPDDRPKLTEQVTIHVEDTTLNVMPATYSNILLPLSEGALQYLSAGARGNVGLLSGRYAFEVKVLEFVHLEENNKKPQQSRHSLRVGVSLARSSLFLGEKLDSVCFDLSGFVVHNRAKRPLERWDFKRGDVVCVVLNLDETSSNAFTISLFKNGRRASPPQPLPDHLKGKALHPTVTFRNVTVHYNFGPEMLEPLPFECRMIQNAAAAEAVVVKPFEPADGVHEVLFPVCLPDEGSFVWLDWFLSKNPHYFELSDRVLVNWAELSGLTRKSWASASSKSSNDKPEMNFGISSLDDLSVHRILNGFTPLMRRNFVVMELKSNLIHEERSKLLSWWSKTNFRKIAMVLMGKPDEQFKAAAEESAREEKQDYMNQKFAQDKAWEKRKKAKERNELFRLRKVEKAKRLADRNKRKAAIAHAKEKGENVEELEAKEAEEIEDSEADVEEIEESDVEQEAPIAELTAEEAKNALRASSLPDIVPGELADCVSFFTLPNKDEGFDSIRYCWDHEAASTAYLQQWIKHTKASVRLEVKPGDMFRAKLKRFQKQLQEWHSKQKMCKAAVQKKNNDKSLAVAKAKAAAVLKKAVAAGIVTPPPPPPTGSTSGTVTEESIVVEEDAEDVDPSREWFEDLDVFAVEDVNDVGNMEPLFSQFGLDDWAMLGLRVEMHLLVQAFRHDVVDPSMRAIRVDNLEYYYHRYYMKSLSLKYYGVESVQELLHFVRDSVSIDPETETLESLIPADIEDLSIFVMLTEEARRERNRLAALGIEAAHLKLIGATPPSTPTPVKPLQIGASGLPIIDPCGAPLSPLLPVLTKVAPSKPVVSVWPRPAASAAAPSQPLSPGVQPPGSVRPIVLDWKWNW